MIFSPGTEENSILKHRKILKMLRNLPKAVRNYGEKSLSMQNTTTFILCMFQSFSKSRLNRFMYHMIALAFATFAATVLQTTFHAGCNLELIVAGTAMPSLPGVAITNAIRDTLHGDYISGAARVMEAFVRAISCAVGIAIGLYFGSLVTGGVL